jgi:hypothetical protein
MTEAINAHKKMAMGVTEGNVMKKGGKVKKYANGGSVNKGAVPESKSRTLMLDSSQKQALPKGGNFKIATMKKGGAARGR